MRSPILYLSEMLSATITIKDFTDGMDKNAFLQDEKTKSDYPVLQVKGYMIRLFA